MSSLQRIFLMLLLTALWSPSFLFIKLAIQDIPPITVVALRMSLAACAMSLLLVFNRRALPTTLTFWRHALILALFASALPFCLFCFAEKSIDSALAAVINGTAPMFTALLSHAFIPSDRLNFQKSLGILLSAGGLIWLFIPKIIETGISENSGGILAAACASACYAISHVYAKKNLTGHRTFVVPTAQMLMASLLLWPLSLMFDHPLSLDFPSSKSLLGVLGLAFFGTFLAFIVYFKLLEKSGPTAVSTVACFFPVGGMLLGFVFLGEMLSLQSFIAAGLIFLGLICVNELIKLEFFLPADRIVKNKQSRSNN